MEPAHFADTASRVRAVRGALNASLRDLTSEQLFTAAKQVGELMEHPGWAFLEQLMEARKARLVTSLVHGENLELRGYVSVTSMLSGVDQMLLAGHAVKQLAGEKQRELEEALRAGEEQN
jgi:hypothetical protein